MSSVNPALAPLPKVISRKALLALPIRKWDQVSEYDSLYIVPTGKKHDSGYSIMAIVGRVGDKAHIAAHCDDIGWTMPKEHPYGSILPHRNKMIMRTDCLFPSGIIHMWASGEHYFKGRFRVGASLSSTDVELFIEPTGQRNQMTGETVIKLEPAQ